MSNSPDDDGSDNGGEELMPMFLARVQTLEIVEELTKATICLAMWDDMPVRAEGTTMAGDRKPAPDALAVSVEVLEECLDALRQEVIRVRSVSGMFDEPHIHSGEYIGPLPEGSPWQSCDGSDGDGSNE